MLLCDDAQAVGGKLYILGGGWSILTKMTPRAKMALAVKLAVPWSRTNEQIPVEANLITDAGEEVTQETDQGVQPVRAVGNIELGRPPGIRPNTPLDAVFVLNFDGLDLEPRGYVWELRVDRTRRVAARIPFLVIQGPAGQPNI
jgi:hypothetical protein